MNHVIAHKDSMNDEKTVLGLFHTMQTVTYKKQKQSQKITLDIYM